MTHAKPIGCRHGNAAPRLSTNPLAGMNAVSLPVGSPQPKRSLLLHDYAFDGNDDYRLSTAMDQFTGSGHAHLEAIAKLPLWRLDLVNNSAIDFDPAQLEVTDATSGESFTSRGWAWESHNSRLAATAQALRKE